MTHLLVQIKFFEILNNYKLKLIFTDGAVREVDLQPLLRGEVYGPLREESFFKQAQLDPEVKTIVWPNGADFEPSLLCNWEQVKNELATRALTWE